MWRARAPDPQQVRLLAAARDRYDLHSLASHLDRHANIGAGHIGAEGFRRILTHPKLRRKAFILETPVDREGDDRRKLDKLKSLATRL
jgi:endonuclease IV